MCLTYDILDRHLIIWGNRTRENPVTVDSPPSVEVISSIMAIAPAQDNHITMASDSSSIRVFNALQELCLIGFLDTCTQAAEELMNHDITCYYASYASCRFASETHSNMCPRRICRLDWYTHGISCHLQYHSRNTDPYQ